jgi:hypothetical protein
MGRIEIENLRVACRMPSVAGKLTRFRMLLVELEDNESARSKRVCDGLRKELHKILKLETQDNEALATAARLLLRLGKIDPFKTRSEKQRAQAEQLLATAQPEAKQPAPVNPTELEQRLKLYQDGV